MARPSDGGRVTIPIMDEFERLNKNGFRIYERLIPNKEYRAFPYPCFFRLIIERRKQRKCVGKLTMTNLKNGNTQALMEHIKKDIEVFPNLTTYKKGENVILSTPFALNVQNSSNREGYGTEWDWSYGVGSIVKEGTKYGETTPYCIVGIEIF